MRVSTATRLRGSCASIASRIESLIWSAILSGWPSVTDSEVKRRRGTRYSLRSTAERGGRVPGGGWLLSAQVPGANRHALDLPAAPVQVGSVHVHPGSPCALLPQRTR